MAATRPYIPVRVDQVADAAIWTQYDVEGVGVFLLLDREGKFVAEVPTADARPDALVRAFTTTLTERWKTFAKDVRPIPWATDLAAATAAAKAQPRPIVVVCVSAGDGSKALLAACEERAVGRHLERFHWVRVTFGMERPEAAKALGVAKAPALVVADPAGAKVLSRVPLDSAEAIGAALEACAAKFEAARKAAAPKPPA